MSKNKRHVVAAQTVKVNRTVFFLKSLDFIHCWRWLTFFLLIFKWHIFLIICYMHITYYYGPDFKPFLKCYFFSPAQLIWNETVIKGYTFGLNLRCAKNYCIASLRITIVVDLFPLFFFKPYVHFFYRLKKKSASCLISLFIASCLLFPHYSARSKCLICIW